MKVTLVHRYFWPDKAPYAQMLFYIAQSLAASGNDVSVLTSMPTHHIDALDEAPAHDFQRGVKIKRVYLLPELGRNLILRALNSWLFGLRVFVTLCLSKNDAVMVATTPPVIIGMLVRWASSIKKFKYIYHCQDLHPEAMCALGLNPKSITYRIFNAVDKGNIIGAARVVVLSEDMKMTLARRKISVRNVVVLNNFIFEKLISNTSTKQRLDSKSFNVLFAGNLGKFQGLQYLIEAAWITKDDKDIHYIIVGDGVERSKLQEQAGELLNKTIFFYGHVSIESALQYMTEADLGIVMLNKNVIEYAYPSKTMMYMSTGLPLLVAVEKKSSLAKDILVNNFGYVCEPEDSGSLAKKITLAFDNKDQFETRRCEIAKFADEQFGAESVLNNWVELYKGIND